MEGRDGLHPTSSLAGLSENAACSGAAVRPRSCSVKTAWNPDWRCYGYDSVWHAQAIRECRLLPLWEVVL